MGYGNPLHGLDSNGERQWETTGRDKPTTILPVPDWADEVEREKWPLASTILPREAPGQVTLNDKQALNVLVLQQARMLLPSPANVEDMTNLAAFILDDYYAVPVWRRGFGWLARFVTKY